MFLVDHEWTGTDTIVSVTNAQQTIFDVVWPEGNELSKETRAVDGSIIDEEMLLLRV